MLWECTAAAAYCVSVQDTLEVKCDVKSPEGCTEKETKFITTMKAKTAEDRTKELTRLSAMKVRAERVVRICRC